MMPGQQLQAASESTRHRPFPWHCPQCRKKEVRPAVISYRCDMTHDGQLYSVTVPELSVPRCGHCGELVFNYLADEQMCHALRSELRLLASAEIRTARTALSLSQKDLADRLGVTEATILGWETGDQIPSRAMDNLLRVFFALPEVRSALLGTNQDPHLGIAALCGG